jgi:hypothetical protein
MSSALSAWASALCRPVDLEERIELRSPECGGFVYGAILEDECGLSVRGSLDDCVFRQYAAPIPRIRLAAWAMLWVMK